jgi:hypothetical protein
LLSVFSFPFSAFSISAFAFLRPVFHLHTFDGRCGRHGQGGVRAYPESLKSQNTETLKNPVTRLVSKAESGEQKFISPFSFSNLSFQLFQKRYPPIKCLLETHQLPQQSIVA